MSKTSHKRVKDFDKIVTRLIAKADAALKKEAVNYDAILGESLATLKKALASNNMKDAIRISYSIKGAAGTLGWPLVSTAAGYLRHVLEENEKVEKLNETIAVHVSTLEILYKNKMKGEHEEGIKLIKNLYNLLIKYNISPA